MLFCHFDGAGSMVDRCYWRISLYLLANKHGIQINNVVRLHRATLYFFFLLFSGNAIERTLSFDLCSFNECLVHDLCVIFSNRQCMTHHLGRMINKNMLQLFFCSSSLPNFFKSDLKGHLLYNVKVGFLRFLGQGGGSTQLERDLCLFSCQ